MTPQELTTLMLAVIVTTFIVGLVMLVWPLLNRRYSLVRARKLIAGRTKSANELEPAERRRITLEGLRNKPFLKEAANAYVNEWNACLIETRDRAIDARPLSAFLSPRQLLPRTANRRLGNSLPGILVALGILGTFLGLVQSLPAVSALDPTAETRTVPGAETPRPIVEGEAAGTPDSDGDGLAEFQQSVREIVLGLSLAFRTSIWGILASVVFIVIDRVAVHRLELAVNELSDEAGVHFPVISRAELARLQLDLFEKTGANIQTLGTDLSTALEGAIATHMRPAMEAIQGSVERLVTYSADEQVAGLQNLVERFTGSMHEALGAEFRELQTILASTVTAQREIGSGLTAFSGQIQESAAVQHRLIKETSRAAETLSGSLDRLETISGLLKDAADDVLNAGAQLEVSAEAATESQKAALEAQRELMRAADVHADAMSKARVDLEQAWAKAVEDATGAIEQIRQATGELTKGISDQLVKALQSFDSSLAETIARFGGTLAQVDGSISELPPAASAMKESAEEMTSRIAELQKTVVSLADLVRGILSENVADASTAAEKLEATLAETDRTVQGLARFSDSLDARLEVLDGMSENLSGMRTTAAEAITGVGTLSERMKQTETAIERLRVILDNDGASGALLGQLSEMSAGMKAIRELTTRLTEASTAPRPTFPFWRRQR